MQNAVAIVVPVCICVVLPIAIVWIVFRSITNKTNRKTEVILEVLKNNPGVDTSKIIEAFNSSNKRLPWQSLNRKLLRGCIFTFLGITFALIGALLPDEDIIMSSWVACGVFGSVGIGFLISYWFAFVHIEDIKKESLSDCHQ